MQQGLNTLQPDGYEVTVARTLGEVEAIRPIWEQMQQNEAHPVPNVDIDRYLCIVEATEGARTHIVLVLRSVNPEAMAIGRVEKGKLNCRIGYKTLLKPTLKCLSIVYGGILGELTTNVCTTLLRELMDTLARGEADVVYLSHVRIDTDLYGLCKRIPGLLCRDRFSRVEKHWETHIPETFEVFCKALSKNRRKERKKLTKRLEQQTGGKIEVKYLCKEEQLDEFIEVCSRMSDFTYKKALNVGFTGDPVVRSLLRQAAQNNQWRGYMLCAGDKPIAFESGIVYGTRFFAEAKGYDPDWASFGPGTILQYKIFEDLCNDPRVNAYDYGYGDAIFKQRFGTDFWQEASVYIFAPRLYPVAVNMLQSTATGLSLGLNYLSYKAGFTRWLKRRWRDRLQEITREKK